MALDLIDDARWKRLVKAFDTREALGSPVVSGSARWNRAVDAFARARDIVVADPALLAQARELGTLTSDPAALQLLWEVTSPPLFEYEQVAQILQDNRVALPPEVVRWEYAVYVVERLRWGREDPYESDVPETDMHRFLTRIGGAPTAIPGFPYPMTPFLLQLDLGEQLRDEGYHRPYAAFLKKSDLPRGGLLQLFHSTTGDSETDPDVPGGGAVVRYFTEEELKSRQRPDLSEDCVMFPVFDARPSISPSFAPTPAASAEQEERIGELQRAVDRGVRGDEPSAAFSWDELHNPLNAVAESVTRVLGVGHYNHQPRPEHVALLHERLPLATEDDRHVLLFDVSSELSLDQALGDPGRLEIWIRRGDLCAHRFDDVVSLWHAS